MKQLVIVKAPASHGKTYTLWELVLKLKASPGFRIIHEVYKENEPQFVVGKLKDNTNRVITVGVITFGDPGAAPDVNACLARCLSEKCDIIFAASRTSGSVYYTLKGFAAANNYATIETSPLYIPQFWHVNLKVDPFNRLFAGMLYEIIFL